jgi:hypothetical protein
MRRISLLVLLCALLTPGVAAASSEGSLTSVEYSQLQTARHRLRSVNTKTAKGLAAQIRDCKAIQEVSRLVTEERTDCIAQARIGDFSVVMQVAVKTCAVYTNLAGRLKCLMPNYKKFYAATSGFYHAESSIHRTASSRGFTAACVNLLSDPPRVITEEKRMLGDVASILVAMKAANPLAFEKYSGETIAAAAQVQAGQNADRGPLSTCAHQ